MPRKLRQAVRCPRANREDDLCTLPPGVRHCLCYGDQPGDPVGVVEIHDGQLFWFVPGTRPRGWYSYLAVTRQGSVETPLELEGQRGTAVQTVSEGGRLFYLVRTLRGGQFLLDAAELIYAAAEGRETVLASPAQTGAI